MRKLFTSLALLALAAPALRADDAIPVETLKEIKAATVFIKVSVGRGEMSGSGFLMKVDGETGYIVTNHHVVTPPPRAGGLKSIQVVFNSGKKDEKVVTAEVLAADGSRDLAILKVTGVKELPKPLDLEQKVELVETMNVYMFGFPFGEALSTTKGNPAMTVGKGSVSSIRENEFDDVAVVQIDGDLNPGNSGGPVVDSKGRLVGVAVAKITNTRIGMAIPPAELTKMMNGRVGGVSFKTLKVEDGKAEIQVDMQLIDPFNKIQGSAIHYVFADKLKEKLKADKAGKWPALPDAEKVELKVKDQKATATFVVKSDAKGRVDITFQSAYVTGEGKTVMTQPGNHPIDFGKPVVVTPNPMPGGKTPDPKATNDALLGEARAVGDLTVMDLKLEAKGRATPRCLCWSPDAKAFYHLGTDGTLRRVGLGGMTEDAKLETQRKCTWLSPSAEGLLLTVAELQEVWVLDPVTLKVKKKIASASVTAAASSPKLSFAFATSKGDSLQVLDLKEGKVVKEYTGRDFEGSNAGFNRPVVSPDGKYLFTIGGIEMLQRFLIDGDKLTFDESSHRIASGHLEGIDVSADSSRVCIPSGGGNPSGKDHPEVGPYCTFIYDATSFKKPVATIKSGAYPQTIGFDVKAKLIYAQNHGKGLMVYTDDGIAQKEYDLGAGPVRQLLAHPDGRKVLALGENKICFVELPKE